MNYRKIINDSFSTLTPLTNNEEIIRSVTERAKKMEKKKRFSIRKPIIAVCAAVAAMAVGTISVGAANGWNYADIFRSLFGDKTENIIENIVPEAVVLEDTIDDMDFEITAAASDKHSALIILDLYGRNGRKFDDMNLNQKRWYFADLKNFDIGISSETVNIMQYDMTLIEGSEDKIRIGITIYTDQEFKDNKIKVCVTELYPSENDESIYYFSDNKWSAELVTDYNDNEVVYENKVLISDETETGDFGFIYAEKIEVSPISICLNGEITDTFFNVFWEDSDIYAVTDSGEQINILNFGKSFNHYKRAKKLILVFEEPVNPEEISCLDINGHIIELK